MVCPCSALHIRRYIYAYEEIDIVFPGAKNGEKYFYDTHTKSNPSSQSIASILSENYVGPCLVQPCVWTNIVIALVGNGISGGGILSARNQSRQNSSSRWSLLCRRLSSFIPRL